MGVPHDKLWSTTESITHTFIVSEQWTKLNQNATALTGLSRRSSLLVISGMRPPRTFTLYQWPYEYTNISGSKLDCLTSWKHDTWYTGYINLGTIIEPKNTFYTRAKVPGFMNVSRFITFRVFRFARCLHYRGIWICRYPDTMFQMIHDETGTFWFRIHVLRVNSKTNPRPKHSRFVTNPQRSQRCVLWTALGIPSAKEHTSYAALILNVICLMKSQSSLEKNYCWGSMPNSCNDITYFY